MWRANIKNRSFDWMGEEWAPLIDPNHFLGRSALDIPYPKADKGPSASLLKEEDLMILEIRVPDYKKDELSVEVKNDLLFVKGDHIEKTKTSTSQHVDKELQRDSFERVFKLAATIAREGVSAKLEEDGILRIRFVDVPAEEEMTHRVVPVE